MVGDSLLLSGEDYGAGISNNIATYKGGDSHIPWITLILT